VPEYLSAGVNENMIRITFINGSYYCESGRTLLKLKHDSFDGALVFPGKQIEED